MKRRYLGLIHRTSLFLITIGLFLVSNIDAQVTIGLMEEPEAGSLLQLKNIKDADGASANANKGLAMPRVLLSKKEQLYPMFLKDPSNPASGSTDEYASDKGSIDKAHTGLVVYNTIANYVEDLCLGLNYWNGSYWQCLMPPIPAEYTLECENIVVEGLYYKDEPLTQIPNEVNGERNRIKVTLTNIPPSAYGSVAKLETNTVDGISFKGEARLLTNTATVYLEGTGAPTSYYNKEMTITVNSLSAPAVPCTATVVVVIPPQRLMTLANTSDYGYNLGLLAGSGRADNSGNDLLTDSDNFGYHPWSIVKFAGFKNHDGSGDTASGARSVNMPSARASDINTWVDDMRDIVCLDTDRWGRMTAATLRSFLEGTNGKRKVDVFMIGYDTNYYDIDKCNVLIDFVKAGGILMICSEETASNQSFMRLFFNKSDIGSASGAGSGSLYTLGFNAANTPESMRQYYCKDDDPILAGPFENLLGKTWGEDASNTRYITNLPVDQLVIYSGAREIGNSSRPAEAVTIFRHKDYPFVFIGDGGFNSNQYRGHTSKTICPFVLKDDIIDGHQYKHYPTYKNFGSVAPNRAYNAVFTANAFAWCIEKANELKQ